MSKAFVYERKGAPQLQSELDALASISENPHPFICLYYGAFQDDRTVSMVLEYLVGGEFYNRLKHVRRINEAAARFYTAGQSEKKKLYFSKSLFECVRSVTLPTDVLLFPFSRELPRDCTGPRVLAKHPPGSLSRPEA